jgi:tRNA pseudouridine(38-40) synthase
MQKYITRNAFKSSSFIINKSYNITSSKYHKCYTSACPPPAIPKQRYRLRIQYDGHSFAGWQRQDRQPHLKTLQQELENALSQFSFALSKRKQHINVHTSSRTDAGVHAIDTIVHFDLASDQVKREIFPDEDTITKGLNTLLFNKKVAVLSCKKVDRTYIARYAAQKRVYRYKIILVPDSNISVKLPLLVKYAWFLNIADFIKSNVPREQRDVLLSRPVLFNYNLIEQAASEMTGKLLDWTSFSSPGDVERNKGKPILTVRTVDKIQIQYNEYNSCDNNDPFNPMFDSITIQVTAKSFLYHQVRYIIHTLLECATGVTSLEEMRSRFNNPSSPGSNRRMAPSQGLFLLKVYDQFDTSDQQ